VCSSAGERARRKVCRPDARVGVYVYCQISRVIGKGAREVSLQYVTAEWEPSQWEPS